MVQVSSAAFRCIIWPSFALTPSSCSCCHFPWVVVLSGVPSTASTAAPRRRRLIEETLSGLRIFVSRSLPVTERKLISHLSFYRLWTISLAANRWRGRWLRSPRMSLGWCCCLLNLFRGSRILFCLRFHRFQKPCIPCFFLCVLVQRASTSVNNRLITD
jgi:hypothetical protein